MRQWPFSIFVVGIGLLAGCGGDSARIAPAPSPEETDVDTSLLQLGGLVVGQVLPKEGADLSSVANADIAAAGHPEVSGHTDGSGNFSIGPILPGQLELFVTSGAAAGFGNWLQALGVDGSIFSMLSGTPAYGLKFANVVVSPGETTDLGKNRFKETGSVSGRALFFTNPNGLDLAGTKIYVPGTGFSAHTDGAGNFALAGLPVGTYELRFEHTGFSPQVLSEVDVPEGANRALGTVSLSLSDGPEGGIAVTPSLTASIGGQARKISTSRTVTIALSYDADAALMKISDEPSFLDCEWVPVAASTQWTFESDGPKSLYVMFSDLNGLESSPFSDGILIDTEAPQLAGISILHGWAQSASRNLFIDSTATDSGAGIAEIIFSNGDQDFSNDSWVAFAARRNWSVTAGAGPKTVYAKVKDYAGRESAVVSDGINLGTSTMVFDREYPEKVKLLKEQSPYLIQSGIVFDGDLEIEAGSEIQFDMSGALEVKGVFTSVGTVSEHIVLRLKDAPVGGICAGGNALTLKNGAPGVSHATRVEYTEFKWIPIAVNGGNFSHNVFFGTGCTTGGVSLTKTGLDSLTVTDNTFADAGNAISVQEGHGNTVFSNNTGTVRIGISQSATATGTTLTDNTLEVLDSSSCALSVSNGTVMQSGNSFEGGVGVCSQGSVSLELSGLTITNCDYAVKADSGTSVTLEQPAISGCEFGVAAGGSVTIRNGTIGVTNVLFLPDSMGNAAVSFIDNQAITCAAASGFCDFFRISGGHGRTYSMTMTGTDAVHCQAASGCRGFVLHKGWSGALNLTLNLTLNDNVWVGKQVAGDFATGIVSADDELLNTTTNAAVRLFLFRPEPIDGTNQELTVTLNATGSDF